MPRADVFIDAANFSIASRTLMLGRYVDIKGLVRALGRLSAHEIGRAYYYDSPSPTRSVQDRKQAFWDSLEDRGIRLRKGRIESNHDGHHREKECDVMMAVDIVVSAYEGDFDSAIVVTGDTDCAEAIKVVQDLGKGVWWASVTGQGHTDRLRQLVPKERQIELTEQILRPLVRPGYSSGRK